jgi:DNA-binding LacI/PurR family transcriptional regulator
MHPRLATVHVYLEEVGRHLAEFVISRMTDPGLAPRHASIPTSLVKGESVRAWQPTRGDVPLEVAGSLGAMS